jgi:hypothetical protein
MAIQPKSRLAKVALFETLAPLWAANAAAIGLAPDEVAAFLAKLASARDSADAAETARNASRNATIVFHTDADAMSGEGGDLMKRITAYAELQRNPAIYALAGLPTPAAPQPKPAPGTPTGFRITLEQTGAVRLTWRCANPRGTQGTIYNVSRRLGSSARSA